MQTEHINKIPCYCPTHKNKMLGKVSNVGLTFLWCRICKKEYIFESKIEPDCLRVTAFIENKKVNEETPCATAYSVVI